MPVRGHTNSRTGITALERELQTKLNVPRGSRTHDRVPGIDIGSSACPAEAGGCRGVILSTTGPGRRAERVGEDGVIEQVEELRPELDRIPLLEPEVLEYRKIKVLEARVPEDVPAHCSKSSRFGWDHDGVSGNEAATCREGYRIGSLSRTHRGQSG